MNGNDTYPINQPNPLDYEQLKEYGLEYIRSIANKQWTDFNLHDPGVTILEALCFSLTDLAYRTRFGMADLLTQKGENHPSLSGTLFPAHEILPHEPITANDYRKYFIETIPGIRNIWVDTFTKKVTTSGINKKEGNSIDVAGRYRIRVELEDKAYILNNSKLQNIISHDEQWRFLESFKTNYKDAYKNYIRNFYLKHRNLCEDLDEVKILDPVHIGIHAEIETERHANHQQIMEEIVKQTSEYFSPALKFHTLAELVKKGKTPEEIYQGPLPRIGFIDTEELAQHKKKDKVFISDILNILMKIKGVTSIKQLYFLVNGSDIENSRIKIVGSISNCKEVHLINEDYVFCLSAFDNNSTPKNEIYFVNNGLTYAPRGIDYSKLSREAVALPSNISIQHEFPIPESRNRNLGTYYSFQHLFPKAYRMGMERIPNSASHLHKAERLQLKAYLTFFDQLIADYLEQLASIEQYFSVAPVADKTQTDRTYFFHELNDEEITDVNLVLSPLAEGEPRTEQQISIDIDRRNRVMDHLLARFNVAFVNYSLLAFLINPEKNKVANQLLSDWGQLQQQFEREETEDKKRLLSNYPILSGTRSRAIDYTEEVKLSGVERMILAHLGVNNPKYDCAPRVMNTAKKESEDEEGNKTITVNRYFYDNRKDNYNDNFGLHIIEHPLLLPHSKIEEEQFLRLGSEDHQGFLLDNPYSFRTTVIVTGWLDICQNMDFRAFVERTIRNNFPAHIVAKICWVDPFVMWKAESAYREYIKILKGQPIINVSSEDFNKWQLEKDNGIKTMMEVFEHFHNIYPSGGLNVLDRISYGLLPRLDFMNIDTYPASSPYRIWVHEEKHGNDGEHPYTTIEKWAFSKQKINK